MKKLLVVLFAVVTLGSCLTPVQGQTLPRSMQLVPRTDSRYTVEEEIAYGRQAIAAENWGINRNGKPFRVYNAELQKYSEQLLKRLLLKAPKYVNFYQYVVWLVYSDELAFSSPDGHIFISLQLLASAESEDELAFVIAHEISHPALRHDGSTQTKIEESNRLTSAFVWQMRNQPDRDLRVFQFYEQHRLFLRQCMHQDEFEADALGARIAMAAGYNPSGAADRLIIKPLDPDDLHPASRDRGLALKEEITALRQLQPAWRPARYGKRQFLRIKQLARKQGLSIQRKLVSSLDRNVPGSCFFVGGDKRTILKVVL